MKLLRATQNAELLNAEKAITERIHRQFLEGAKLQDILKKPDTFFTEVNIENANATFERLQFSLNDKLTTIISISEYSQSAEYNKLQQISLLKQVCDSGKILTDWNSLSEIIISPKTKREISEQLTAKMYSLEELITKICSNYVVFLKGSTFLEDQITYLTYIVQLISNLGIYLIMQKQILTRQLGRITLNEIKIFLTFNKIKSIFATGSNNWARNFVSAANPVGYISVTTDRLPDIAEGTIKQAIDLFIKMFYNPDETRDIAKTKKRFLREMQDKSAEERSPIIFNGLPDLVFNDPAIEALNPIYASAIAEAEEFKQNPDDRQPVRVGYSPEQLIEMGRREKWNPHLVEQLMNLGRDRDTTEENIRSIYEFYIEKYAIDKTVEEAYVNIDRTQIIRNIIARYNKFGEHSDAEVLAKINELENGRLRALFVPFPRDGRGTRAGILSKRVRFVRALQNAQDIELNYLNENYNTQMERLIQTV